MNLIIGDFTLHFSHEKYFDNTVLISNINGSKNVTVAMMKNSLEYFLSIKAIKYPKIEKYKKAKKFFETFILLFGNKTAPKLSKDYFKATADVIEEIENLHSKNDAQKEYNAFRCWTVKMLIDYFW